MEFNTFYFLFLILIFFQLFFFQIKKLDIQISSECLKAFKSNNILGFLILVNLILGKI